MEGRRSAFGARGVLLAGLLTASISVIGVIGVIGVPESAGADTVTQTIPLSGGGGGGGLETVLSEVVQVALLPLGLLDTIDPGNAIQCLLEQLPGAEPSPFCGG